MDGAIHSMEFLYPPKDDQNLVILILIVCFDGRFVLQRYDWDCSLSIDNARQVWSKINIPLAWNMPLLLIPITITAAFMILFEEQTAVYSNVLIGSSAPKVLKPFAPKKDPSLDSNDLQALPLWTAWARPHRVEALSPKADQFFLAREDGVILYIELSSTNGAILSANHDVGSTNSNIDQAFAILDTHDVEGGWDFRGQSSDLLITTGSMSDGGLYQFQTVRQGRLVQHLPNWSPISDFAVIPNAIPDNRISRPLLSSPCEQHRVFTCSGSGQKHGTVREIRTGLLAQNHKFFRYDLQSCTGLWTLRNPLTLGLHPNGSIRYGQHIILSYSDRTEFTYLAAKFFPNLPQLPTGQVYDLVAYSGLLDALIGIGQPTLAVGVTENDILVQVTPECIRALPLTAPHPHADYVRTLGFNGSVITHASLEETMSTVLLCTVSDREPHLRAIQILLLDTGEVKLIQLGGQLQPPTLHLSDEPCSVVLHYAHGNLFGLVGTADRKLHAFWIGQHPQLYATYDFPGEDKVCSSICVSPCRDISGQSRKYRLICGLRTGELHVVLLNVADDFGKSWRSISLRTLTMLVRCTMHCTDVFTLGTTSVTTCPEPTSLQNQVGRTTQVVLACHDSLYQLRYPTDAHGIRPTLNQIWLTDAGRQGECGTKIMTVTQALPQETEPHANLPLLCARDGGLSILDFESAPVNRTVPLSYPVEGTPTRIIYHKWMNRLIVAYSQFHTVDPDLATVQLELEHQRLQFSRLAVIDPNGHDPSNAPENAVIVGHSGEKVTGLTEWTARVGHRTWHLVIASTSSGRTGRIAFFSATRSESGELEYRDKLTLEEGPPVAIAPYDSRAICYCTGEVLHIWCLDAEGDRIKWGIHNKVKLRSPATFLSVCEPYIYASTTHHSVVVFKVEGYKLSEAFFEEESSASLTHQVLPGSRIVSSAGNHGKVRGLWHPSADSRETRLHCIFEAKLTGSISRFWTAPTLLPQIDGQAFVSANGTARTADWIDLPPRVSIVGASFDGAFHQLDLLSHAVKDLLLFVQKRAVVHPAVCPVTHKQARLLTARFGEAPAPGPLAGSVVPVLRPKQTHVDGDLLARILERGDDALGGSRGLLWQLVCGEGALPGPPGEMNGPDAQMQEFERLVQVVWGYGATKDPFQMVVDYLKLVVQETTWI